MKPSTFRQPLLLVALGLALRPSSANPGNDSDLWYPPGQVPDQTLEDPSSTRFIITYANEEGHGAVHAKADKVHKELGPQNAVAAEVKTPEAVVALSNNPNILSIEVDPPRYFDGSGGVRSGGGGAVEAASDTDPTIPKGARRLAETVPYGITMVQADQVSHDVAGKKKVCIIDSGYHLTHEDLPTTNVNGSPTGWDSDTCSHGTHVAGTVAALGKNAVGVRGVVDDGQLDLHIVKVFDGPNCRWSYSSDLVAALNECVAANANIVSMSLGGPSASTAESTAFQTAYDNGVLSIAASGNDAPSTAYSYPASYDSVVSVGAVDSDGNIASFSTQNNQVELSAPGVFVRSTLPPNTYGEYDGTSMATPHVSGVAALLWSRHGACSAGEIRNALTSAAEDRGAVGRDVAYGFGIVKALDADAYLNLPENACTGGTVPPPAPAPTPAPVLAPPPEECTQSGGDCSQHSQCCSGWCKKGQGRCG